MSVYRTVTVRAILHNPTITANVSLVDNVIREKSSNLNVITHNSELFEGPYSVTPKVIDQLLETRNKVMQADVTVFKIPYFQTSNQSGDTVYIGSEI